MIPDIDRTIVALGSSTAGARRAIVRLSGPGTLDILRGLIAGTEDCKLLESKNATSGLVEIALGQALPTLPARLLIWPDLRSYTGQPSAELHMLGSAPLVQLIMDRACRLGAEPAERGEFTLRAFLAGKLDLAQAEAVLGVIEASTPDQLQTALAQLGGNLAPEVRPLRDQIVDLLAHLEAGLDFVEEDIEFISSAELSRQLSEIRESLAAFAVRLDTRSSTSHAPRAVLVGLPNSGKSSLFNALCGDQRAIVTSIAGTTRDYLTARITAAGHEVDLIDTAGLEEASLTTARGLAQDQLRKCIASSDLLLWCVDSSDFDQNECRQTEAQIATAIQLLRDRVGDCTLPIVLVQTKADLLQPGHEVQESQRVSQEVLETGSQLTSGLTPQQLEQRQRLRNATPCVVDAVATSAKFGCGLEELRHAVAAQVSGARAAQPLALVHHTAVRCRAAVNAAIAGITYAIEMTDRSVGEELVAGELRLVLDELAAIIGEVHSDDILGEIFGRFCIGK